MHSEQSISLRSDGGGDDVNVGGFAAKIYTLFCWICFIQESDDFVQRVRKVSVTVLLLCSPCAFAYSTYWAWIAFIIAAPQLGYDKTSIHPPVGAYLECPNAFILGLVCFIPYIVGRRKGYVSTAVVDVIGIAFSIIWPLGVIGIPEFDTRGIAFCMALLMTLSEARYKIAYNIVMWITAVFTCYNDAFLRAEGEVALVMLPGARLWAPPLEVLFGLFTGLFCASLAVIGVHLQIREHKQQLSAAESAVKVSHQIVELLRKYNTEGVADALKVAASNTSMDPKLLESFRAMNDNLERYKPLLPNYIFLEEEATDDDDSDAPQNSSAKRQRGRSVRDNDVESEGSIDLDNDENSSVTDSKSRRASCSSSHSRSAAAVMAYQAEAPGIDRGPASARYKGKIAYGMICLHSASQSPLAGTEPGSEKARHVLPHGWRQLLIDAIHAVAIPTKASIHSLVGDVAILTWNATHRVPQPEIKSCKFLAALEREAREANLNVSAAVFSGIAECEALTTNTKQQALLVSAEWLPALETLFGLARRYRTVLIDDSTFKPSTYTVEARAVDYLRLPRALPSDGFPIDLRPMATLLVDSSPSLLAVPLPANHVQRTVYELVGECHSAEDEWMYQLQHHESKQTTSQQINAAAEMVDSGRVAEALGIMRSIEAQQGGCHAPLVRRFQSWCQAAVEE